MSTTVFKLSAGAKNVLDTVLGIAGSALALLVGQAASFTGTTGGIPDQVIVGLIGLAGGYFVSDALTYVDTGQAPTLTVVQQQAAAVIQQLQTIPNLTQQEKQILALALGVAQKYQPAPISPSAITSGT